MRTEFGKMKRDTKEDEYLISDRREDEKKFRKRAGGFE